MRLLLALVFQVYVCMLVPPYLSALVVWRVTGRLPVPGDADSEKLLGALVPHVDLARGTMGLPSAVLCLAAPVVTLGGLALVALRRDFRPTTLLLAGAATSAAMLFLFDPLLLRQWFYRG